MTERPDPTLVDAITRAVETCGGRKRGDELRFLCPAHDDEHPSADWNPVKAVWSCFSCGAKGGARDLAERLGVDLANGTARRGATRPVAARPAPAAAEEPPALPLPTEEELAEARQRLVSGIGETRAKAREYLAARGIDPAACGWGLSADGERLLAPVYLPDGQLGDVRRRRWRPGGNDRTKVLPWAKGHGSAKPYGWHRLESGPGPVVWCEGETDREALAAHGIAAVTNTNGAGSARKVAEELVEELVSSRRFLLLFDYDQPGRDAVAKLAPVLLDRGAAEVSVATWPATLPDGRETPGGFDVCDWFASGFTAEQLRGVLAAAVPFEPDEGAAAGKPQIVLSGRQFDDVVAEAVRVVCAANKPAAWFMRLGELVNVGRDERGRAAIHRVSTDGVILRLAQVADWHTMRAKGEEWIRVPARPDAQLARSALSETGIGLWDVPPLEAVTEVPTLRPDGSILSAPGYDPATKLYYSPPRGLDLPAIPKAPTREESRAALRRVARLLAEFPFVKDADRVNALGLLLTPVVRAAVPSPVPLALIDAPQQGTGKSLIAQVVGLLAQGFDAADAAPSRDDAAEWRKRLTSALLAGNAVINFDNLEGELSNATLAGVLTAAEWRDRLMGTNDMASLPVRVTWIATGNNIRIGGDMNRRCYRIRLDAKTNRPWERSGFAIDDLPAHVLAHRGELLADLLTAARGWYAADQPAATGLPRMGGYWPWVRIVGGILAFCGEDGFLSSQEELYEEADVEAAGWRTFLSAWRAWCPDPVTTRRIAAAVASVEQSSFDEDSNDTRKALAETVPEALMNPDGTVNTVKFGKRIVTILGRRFNAEGLRVEAAGEDSHAGGKRFVVAVDEPSVQSSAPQPRSQSGSAEDAEDSPYKVMSEQEGTARARTHESDREQPPHPPQVADNHAPRANSDCGGSEASSAGGADPDDEGADW